MYSDKRSNIPRFVDKWVVVLSEDAGKNGHFIALKVSNYYWG